MKKLSDRYAPNGKRIIGTFETLKGCAKIQGFFKDGTVEYSGDTEVFWDEQRTVVEKGQKIYVDEDYGLWPEKDLRKTPSGRRKASK